MDDDDDNGPPLSRRDAQLLKHIIAMEEGDSDGDAQDGNVFGADDTVPVPPTGIVTPGIVTPSASKIPCLSVQIDPIEAPCSSSTLTTHETMMLVDDFVVPRTPPTSAVPPTGIVTPGKVTPFASEIPRLRVQTDSIEAPCSSSTLFTDPKQTQDDAIPSSDPCQMSDENEAEAKRTSKKRFFSTLPLNPSGLPGESGEQHLSEIMDNRDTEEYQGKDSELDTRFDPSYFWDYVHNEDYSVPFTSNSSTEPPEAELEEELLEETMQEELESEQHSTEQMHTPFQQPNEDPIYPGAPINVWESLTSILTFVQSEHLSGAGLGRLLSLLDLHLPQPNKLVKSQYSVLKLLENVDEPVDLHFFCTLCYKTRKSLDDLCDTCTDPTRKVDYFMTFPLAHQMKRLFQRPDFVQNIRYQQTRVKQNPLNIEDIYDGEIYKKAVSLGYTANGLTFLFDTDGIPVFKSTTYSLWPFYLVTLELPPEKRFLSENLIVAGIWGSTVKPHPNVFLVPIYKELMILKAGIDLKIYGEEETQKVTGTVICGTCDSPATASFMNMKIHSGFYSCPVCTTKGTHPGDATVFPYEENVPLRNMADYEKFVQRAVKDKIILLKTVKHEERYCGIKGPTVLSSILDDMFAAMAIDGMHCLYLGVTRQMIKLLFVEGKYKHKAAELTRKLLELSPPDYLQRLPQAVEKLIHWKATEFRSFLFNLSVLLFEDILDPEDHRHWCLFVKGVSLLNSMSISDNDIDLAENLLREFVQEFEQIYGVENVTHNVHMLLHLARAVRLLGPLWCVSCFLLEDINGRVLNLVHGTRHVGLQIHSNISVITKLPLMIHSLKEGPVKDYCRLIKRKYRLHMSERISPGTYCVGDLYKIKIEMAWVLGILRKEKFANPLSDVLIFYRLYQRKLLYVSSLYRCKRVSSFVKYSKDSTLKYGNIICFAKVICKCSATCSCQSQYVAIVKPVPVTPKEVHGIVFDHLLKCDPTCQVESFFLCEAVPVTDIECVLFMVESAGRNLAEPLNKYELE